MVFITSALIKKNNSIYKAKTSKTLKGEKQTIFFSLFF